MNTIKVNKKELLSILESNLIKHKDDYKRLYRLYEKAATDALNKELAKIMVGKEFALSFHRVIKPVSNEKDYENAIAMLKMHVDDVIEIDQSEYRQYVQDQWHFTGVLNSTKSNYGIQ